MSGPLLSGPHRPQPGSEGKIHTPPGTLGATPGPVSIWPGSIGLYHGRAQTVGPGPGPGGLGPTGPRGP